MVMEFVEGTPLSQIILQGPVQLDDTMSVAASSGVGAMGTAFYRRRNRRRAAY